MITDTDIKKLKTVFATKEDLIRFSTKEDLDESEARTAFGFTDVQKQLNVIKEDVAELKEDVAELKEGQADLKEEFGEMKLQMRGMERNIISAIHEIKDDHEETKVRVTRLEKIVLAG